MKLVKLAIRVRESDPDRPESDPPSDVGPPGDAPERVPYESVSPPLRLRCYACAGCGRLWIADRLSPRGRQVRCIACRGTGRVTIP